MSRGLLLAAAAALAAGAATAQDPTQRLDVDPAIKAPHDAPIALDGSRLIVSELTESDYAPLPGFRAEYFRFSGHAGDKVSAQVKTDVYSLQVAFSQESPRRRELARDVPERRPMTFVLPRDGTYLLVVDSRGPRRYGKYELDFQTSASPPAPVGLAAAAEPAAKAAPPASPGPAQGAPALEQPKPPAVEVAGAAKPAPPPAAPTPQPAAPKPAQVQAAAPVAPKASALAANGPPRLPKIPGVINARSGQTLSRPAAAKPGPATEMFQFLAAGGSDLQFTASGSGKLMLTLYTIDGEEILSASGADILRLDAIAPRDDLYFLSVWRANAAKPYRLNLVEKEADPLAAVDRYGVGYEELDDAGKVKVTSCWVQPGVKQRVNHADGRVVVGTYLGDGHVRAEVSRPGKPSGTAEWSYQRNGEEVLQTYVSGKTASFRPFESRYGAYRGYLCQ